MLTLDRPNIDWVTIAKGYGVEAGRAATLDELAVQFTRIGYGGTVSDGIGEVVFELAEGRSQLSNKPSLTAKP